MANMAWYDTAQIFKIKKAKEEKEWFTAVVLSATQLERHGYLKVKEYLESLSVKPDLIDKILEKIHLFEIAKYLLAVEKINDKEYNTLIAINQERNNFIHRREKEKFKRGSEAQEKYVPLIDEAIRILEENLNARRLCISK